MALVADIWPGNGGISPGFLVPVAGKRYFAAADPIAGIELRVFDPALPAAGAAPIPGYDQRPAPEIPADLYPGSEGGWPDDLVALDGKLYFAAFDTIRSTGSRRCESVAAE